MLTHKVMNSPINHDGNVYLLEPEGEVEYYECNMLDKYIAFGCIVVLFILGTAYWFIGYWERTH